ncbi:MAG: hypothetical protein FWB96_13245, partial [Defluviitaleaceae bacterium]|nr:hypothetical protein [Defluviitaleaceae bacterium]
PAETFITEASVNFNVRTYGGNGAGWGPQSANVSFPLVTINPPQPAINLQPSTRQNPTRQIQLRWEHVPAGEGFADSQDDSEVQVWRSGSNTPPNGLQAIPGEFGNRLTLMADTFEIVQGEPNHPVRFRARTHGLRGGWGEYSAVQTFNLALDPPLAPTNLTPNGATQNRRTVINLSWRHTSNPADMDTQTDSLVRYRQGNSPAWDDITPIRAGTSNRLDLQFDTFTTNTTVQWRVAVETLRNGAGTWSAVATFALSSFAPQAPTNLAPTETRNPRLPMELTWRHVANERWFPNDGQVDSLAEGWQGDDPGEGNGMQFRGYAENRAIIPPNTFTDLVPLYFRAKTSSNLGGDGPWSEPVQIPLAITPPLAPENIEVLTQFPNPRGIIRVSFTHTKNPDAHNDAQTDSILRIWHDERTPFYFHGGTGNIIDIPAFTLSTAIPTAYFQVCTVAEINGDGDWSEPERIDLMATPPHASVLTHPDPRGVAVPATGGVFLQWSYNSPYDTFPSRFDVRYRIGDVEYTDEDWAESDWVYIQINSQDGIPAATNTTTRAETMQKRLEWQVRAWGELGDMGRWSGIAVAFIIGTPQTPTIVTVANSGRPQITFSAQNALAWEIEIYETFPQHRPPAESLPDELQYSTGKRVFTGAFIHRVERLFANSLYRARIRIFNEYDIPSEWSQKFLFFVGADCPQALTLTTANNLKYGTTLWFDGSERTVYIYRAELVNDDFTAKGEFLRIARVVDAKCFEDWTARPGQRYKYFVRVVNADYGFADSNVKTARSEFMETTIATADTPKDIVSFKLQLGRSPTKDGHSENAKTLTHFTGRERPVLQVGTHISRAETFEFYVSLSDLAKLKKFDQSNKTLILRDWRKGVIYGTITGGIRDSGDGFSARSHVSFVFTETDYPREVEIE